VSSLDQTRFLLTSSLYKKLFNYNWYSSDIRYFMAKMLNSSVLSFNKGLRRELLDYSYYKIKPKLNNIRDGFNLSDFYSIRHRNKNLRYKRYLSLNNHVKKSHMRRKKR